MINTIEYWIKKEQEPRTISLWGTVCQADFIPELCSSIDGDGQQLIYFGTINQRPRYWLVQIDSSHDVESDDFYEKIEEILISPLCEEFGETEWITEEKFNELRLNSDDEIISGYDNYDDWMNENLSYPRLSIDGYYWGLIANVVTGEIG